ncbi:MATE family efflux transporter [Marinitoga sp. 38H-ov]|uniref:MATE family efflux transporter n=1 Tax=Marinitoga sp. 38H-ov TaxID=1755814 RepID=UPI0019D1CAB5|nr:MATE family efflux transporter [Marinitoga sp. 38H-ov]
MAKDLTRGSIFKELLLMSIPTSIGFTFQMIYDLVDIYWIGMISKEAIAGVGIFSTVFWVVEALNEIIGVSSISLISQNYGRKDIKKTNLAIEQTIAFKFFVALIGSIFFAFFLEPILQIFADDTVIQYGLDYGYIRVFFLPIMFSSFSVNTALRNIGDSKTPMNIMIFASILNVLLDPILIFDNIPFVNVPGFGLGIKGAAIATIISQSIAFLIGFYILFSGKRGIKPSIKGLFKLNWEIDKKLLTIGLPNGLEVFARQMSMTIILYFISIFGTSVVSGYTVAGRIFGLAFMPLVGLSMGGSAIVGQSLGAEKIDRAEKTAKISAITTTALTLIFMIIVFLFSENIIGLFSSDPEVIKYGSEFLVFGSLGLLFVSYAFGIGIVFPGSGYNTPYFFMSLGSRWFVQIPLLFLFINIMHLPVLWVWLSFVFGDLFEFVIAMYFYKQGKWKYKRV